MAKQCIYGGGECIECMNCESGEVVFHDIYETEIKSGDEYYEFYNKQIVADSNVSRFLKVMTKVASKPTKDEYDDVISFGEKYYCIYGDIVSEKNLVSYLHGWKKYASYN